jgi:hypothetical protein
MLDAKQVVDKYFLETRCMLIEIAATLDRVERAAGRHVGAATPPDDRIERIRKSLAFLANENSGPNRSEQVLLMFTDADENVPSSPLRGRG